MARILLGDCALEALARVLQQSRFLSSVDVQSFIANLRPTCRAAKDLASRLIRFTAVVAIECNPVIEVPELIASSSSTLMEEGTSPEFRHVCSSDVIAATAPVVDDLWERAFALPSP